MKKFRLLLCASLFTIFANAQDTLAIVNNTPVLPAPQPEMEEAILKSSLIIKDVTRAASLFNTFALVGPALWNKIKDDPEFKDIESSNVIFKIPKLDSNGNWNSKIDVQGKVFQDSAYYLNLWSFIKSNFALESAKIVDKNLKDKFLLWQYFAKIEEPVIVLKTEKARLLLKFVEGKLFFIELSND